MSTSHKQRSTGINERRQTTSEVVAELLFATVVTVIFTLLLFILNEAIQATMEFFAIM